VDGEEPDTAEGEILAITDHVFRQHLIDIGAPGEAQPLKDADECGVHCQTHLYDGEDPIRRA
jgi:hypothetical protein